MDYLFRDTEGKSLKTLVNDLFEDQLQNWDMARANYQGLQKAVTKSIPFSPLAQIRVQFNPERIYSTSAKVDPGSISKRPCFLCPAHLPEQQKGILFGKDYLLLVNPFPIFKRHLTIPIIDHAPQRLEGRFQDMLLLAKELDEFVVFYNGPRCGASAPDHFHFQAGNKGFLPIEQDFEKPLTTTLFTDNGSCVFAMEAYLRHALAFSSPNRIWLETQIGKAIEVLSRFEPDQTEPMMNILAIWNHDHWRIFLFPRNVHRPWQFFAEGTQKIMLSPAAVDLGGVLIIPRQEDFDKLDLNTSRDVLRQVTLDNDKWEQLKQAFLYNN